MNDLRRCEPDDAARMHAIVSQAAATYAAILGEDFEPGGYMPVAELLSEMKRMTFYGTVKDGVLAGVIGYQPLRRVALVRHAYVSPEWQRQGLGSRLIRHVEGLARADRYDRLLVGTYAAAEWAINFYRRHGFVFCNDSQGLLARYWDIPRDQATASLVLEKKFT